MTIFVYENLSKFCTLERNAKRQVEELATVNKDSGGRFLRLWDEAMCSESARAQARVCGYMYGEMHIDMGS